MAPGQDAFSLQVTSELMQKLTKENIIEKRPAKPRKPAGQKAAQCAPKQQPSMKPVEPQVELKKQDQLPLPYYPGFLSALPGMNKTEVQTQHDLGPIYKVLEETEKLGEKLQRQEEKELEKVKQLAQDLQEKQFRAPSNPIPCQTEKEACLQCYRDCSKSPLACAETVRTFKECSQRVQQEFAQRTAAVPQCS